MIDSANIMTGALAQALETMAFMEIMSAEEDASAPEETFCAEISFSGPQQGSIQIVAGRRFAETLAENIGALDEVTEADCRDALKELANVTCGLITPIIASDLAEVFELSIPCINDADDVPTWHAWTTDPEACLLNVEGHMIVAKLTVHDSCPISGE
jgi:hypothetical protein